MTLEQAAKQIDLRHKYVTGENQHIEKKTLDDYYAFIKLAGDPSVKFDFTANKDKEYGVLRKLCLEKKNS